VGPIFADDFSDDLGWEYGPTWERGPAVASPNLNYFVPDPAEDHSSSVDNYLAGVDIGGNVSSQHDFYYLTSPVVDLSGTTAPHLYFWRYLNSDYAPFVDNVVQAYDGQQWQTLWVPGGGFFVDEEWTLMSFDLAAFAHAQFRLRFGYAAGAGAMSCPSWSLDDVLIVDQAEIEEVGMCCQQTSQCQSVEGDASVCLNGVCE